MRQVWLTHPYDKKQLVQEPIILALGFFDGVHRGHRAVIERAVAEGNKRHLPVAVMTFTHYPALVFQKMPPGHPTYLTTIEQKAELLEQLGVSLLYVVPFTSQLASLTPEAFVSQYIVNLHAVAVVAGADYTYGKRERANMAHLPEDAKGRFDVIEVPLAQNGDEKISSSAIRQAIERGQIADANRQLGYPYQVTGTVIHGDARGREIGYPTANVLVDPQQLIPAVGVYAVRLQVGGQWYRGMASIGYNITFERQRPLTVEIHLFDFDQQIYGEPVRVSWHDYLRPELKFSGVAELVEQLGRDAQATHAFFESEQEA